MVQRKSPLVAVLMLGLIGIGSARAQVVLNPIEKITFKFKNPPKQTVTRFEVGDSKLGLTWITLMRQDLTYNCSFSGGAPADAALASSSEQQPPPLRAGVLRWNGISIRFDAKQADADPISGGKPLGYVFSRKSAVIGGLDLGGGLVPPSVFLPPKGATDRDTMMVAALSLVYFQDPGGQ